MKYYAGIGSRTIPVEIGDKMLAIAAFMRDKGYILRSGGADGSDLSFESGAGDMKEIFIPWKNFNGSGSDLYHISWQALEMAEKYHPKWDTLSQGARKLMARNCYQVLGLDLRTPVDLIVCWTHDGGIVGGTGQALRMARDLDIPVFNLYNEGAEFDVRNYVQARLF